MALRAVPDESQYWVDAAPFRAQLRYLMASTSLSAEEVATAAGISARLADRLLHGRNGRALRRVSSETGRRLLRLSVDAIRPHRPDAGVAA
jgi:transcriptional regulator with XRE-family HTH domain